MKYVLILLILVVLGALIYRRFRPYLRVARQVFETLQTARRMSEGDMTGFPNIGRQAKQVEKEKLIRCQICGTWTPASRAINEAYCSIDCSQNRISNASRDAVS